VPVTVSIAPDSLALLDSVAAAFGISRGKALERCLFVIRSKWYSRSIRKAIGRLPKWAALPPAETKGGA
jgi:hypothetical protein